MRDTISFASIVSCVESESDTKPCYESDAKPCDACRSIGKE
jgi:hypothetical protein